MLKKHKIDSFNRSQPNFKYLFCDCGEREKVGYEIISVQCSRCTMTKIPMPAIKETQIHISSGKPQGWHFMKEFIDKDGNVYHRGIEQPKLKGTLNPTKIIKKSKKIHKTKEQKLIDRYDRKTRAIKKQNIKLQKAIDKQKKFLNHDIRK